MERVIKIVVFIILAILLLFLIFRNISGVEEANRNLPSEEELSEFNNVSSKSSDNSYEVKDIPNKELATIYYNHFKNLVVNDLEGAYKRVRNKDAVLLEDFQMFRADLINNYYSNKIRNYLFRSLIYEKNRLFSSCRNRVDCFRCYAYRLYRRAYLFGIELHNRRS